MATTNEMLAGLREARKTIATGEPNRLMARLRREALHRDSDTRQVALMSLAYLRRTVTRRR